MGQQEAPGETKEAKTATGAVNSPWPGRWSIGLPHLHLLRHHDWQIEGMFGEMAAALQAEIDTLCYPRAALLAFCLGLTAMNVFAVVKAALRAAHGAEAVEEVSGYYLADELAGTYRGMMIALPGEEWVVFREMTVKAFAGLLRQWAGQVRLSAFRRHRRGPKKPPSPRRYNKNKPHVSTARLLEQRKKCKPTRKFTP